MNKEEFIRKIEQIKIDVPNEQFFLEYNECVYDILEENEKYKEVIDKLSKYLRSNEYAKDYANSNCRTTLLNILKEVE